MKYTKLAATLFFAGVLLLSGCSSDDKENPAPTSASQPAPAPAPEPTPQPAPEPASKQVLASTTITTTDGIAIKVDRTASGLVFNGYEGKIILLEVFGDTCPHCVDAIPKFNRLQAKYPNDVYVIALESYGNLNNAGLQQFAATNGVQYDLVATENSGNMFSFLQTLTGYTLNQGVPALLILERDGDLAEYIPPSIPNEAYIDGIVQGLL